MRNDTRVGRPSVKQEAGRLDIGRRLRVGPTTKGNRGCRARSRTQHRTTEPNLHKPMNVSAQNPFDGRKAPDYFGQSTTSTTPIFIDVRNATLKGGLVHHEHHGSLGFKRKRVLKPDDDLVVHVAVVQSRDRYIETNDPNRSVMAYDEVKRSRRWQIGVVYAALPERLPFIVIPRE